MIEKETDPKQTTAYDAREGSDASVEYDVRHGIESRPILTIHQPAGADLIARYLEPRIAGRTVVEIGGGIGLLALRMGDVAKQVFCIEANPAWSHAFVEHLFATKPKNVSYLFGAADEFAGHIHADVALFCAYSGSASLHRASEQFAPEVIDVFGDLLRMHPHKIVGVAKEARQKFLRPIAPPGNVWKAPAATQSNIRSKGDG